MLQIIGKTKFEVEGSDQFILKKINLTVIPHQTCETKIKGLERLHQNWKLHDSFMCAEGENGSDSCSGDGGGK